MRLSYCEYCDGVAELNFGELWLCDPHGTNLLEYVGGLERLLELPPEARRSVADAVLTPMVRRAVLIPLETPEEADSEL